MAAPPAAPPFFRENNMNKITCTAIAILALALGAAHAQPAAPSAGSSMTGGQAAPAAQPGTGTRNTPAAKARLAHADRKFFENAAEGGMFEVQVGQLAAGQASDPQVKSFGSMLVDQHTAANNELVQLANAKGFELPAAPHHGLRRDIDKLGKRNGADFDEHFVREVGIKSHEKTIRMFEKAARDVKDADLKAFITKTLPTLRDHLAMAQKLPQAGRKG
jgi:putative membrane protein